MDRYQRVEKPREDTPIKENEIRITTQGRMRNYISYATSLLQDKGSNEIVLKAMGRAINKTVMIVELIKRRVAGLHQMTVIGSTDITDTWEPLEEGLLPIETTRHVSLISITLSTEVLDTSSVGYQPPLPSEQVTPLADVAFDEDDHYHRNRGRGGRTRGRGRGNPNPANDYQDGSWSNSDHEYGGRGLARRFRGRGRGGYGGRGYPQNENGEEQEPGSFNPPPPPHGRGRGRGRGGGRGRGKEFRSNEPSGAVDQE